MAMLLKRVLKSVSSNRSVNLNSSSSSENNDFNQSIQSSTGSFEKIPFDVFMIIMKFLEPRDVARASTVCKSWKLLVSDNQLWVYFFQKQQESWESISFAETHLRAGKPLQTYYNHRMPLPYMQIYGQRTQVMGSVVIDGGSGYCKFGWSKYSGPSGCSATFMEFGNIESPMYSRLQFYFATIYSRMQVKPSTQPVVLSIPICHCDDTESSKAARRQLKQTIYKVLFDMNVPAVCSINQAVLALYAARRTSGIVVNIGFRVTSIVPIFQGKVMHEIGIEVVGQGALKLTGFLKELMHQKNINVESLYTIRTLKEKLCYIAADYEKELCKDTQATYEVLGDGHYTLSKERFQTGEILFQPRMGGLRTMGLHQAVALCMDHCQAAYIADTDEWFKTVVLAGGTACLPGLPERLHKELCQLLPPSISNDIRVIPPPYGTESAWFGAKLVSNISTFRESWCMTKKQYRKKMKGYAIRL